MQIQYMFTCRRKGGYLTDVEIAARKTYSGKRENSVIAKRTSGGSWSQRIGGCRGGGHLKGGTNGVNDGYFGISIARNVLR